MQMPWISLLLVAATANADPQPDCVIENVTIYDGSGSPGHVGTIFIGGDRIVSIEKSAAPQGARRIDGTDLIAAPGFIDLHSHSDRPITKPATRQNVNYLTQGVTSIVTGNCGSGPVDVGQYLAKIDEGGAGTNVLHLLPHGSMRRSVLGQQNARPSSPVEIQRMCELTDLAMKDGAWGMATGLIYLPGSFATTDELVAVASVVAEHDGIYASHMRNEGTRLLQAIDETLEIGRRAKLPVHISHFKASGRPAWGLAADAIEKVRGARAEGQAVTADQYPYPASSTSLAAMVIPAKYRSQDLKALLNDPAKADQVREAIQRQIIVRGDGASLFVASYRKNRDWQGKDLASLAADQNISVLEVVLEIQRNGGASMVNFGMSEEEVRLIMQQPFVATASDGSAKVPDETVPHPRSYGCFPRKIGHYAIEGKILSLSQAIRSASGLPADILRLPRRGYIRPGYFADLVIFDPATFRDTATFQKPHQYSTGVKYLFVNGKLAIDQGKPTGTLAGRALRHGTPD